MAPAKQVSCHAPSYTVLLSPKPCYHLLNQSLTYSPHHTDPSREGPRRARREGEAAQDHQRQTPRCIEEGARCEDESEVEDSPVEGGSEGA